MPRRVSPEGVLNARFGRRDRQAVPATTALGALMPQSAASPRTQMFKLSRIVVLVVLLAIAGGAVFLANWQIPAPTAKVEKVIPNDRFPR